LDCKFHAIDLKARTETKVLKNTVNKKPRKNSTGIISVTGLEGKKPNRTEPKLIGLNRFSVRFGFQKKIGLVVYFGPKPDRTENAQP